MAGKFTSTNYTKTIDNLVDATKSKLINNPYYIFADQKPTKVDYYAQNVEKSTLDEASGLYGAHVGKDSPFKFNKIKDFYLYGIEKITTDYDVGDYGTEAASITGDCIILPNSIMPRPGDFFYISYLKQPMLFKVNAVTPDTLDNGSNFYKIEYSLELTNTIDSIENQVVSNYSFIVGNVGTDYKCVLESNSIQLIEFLETLIEELITSFENIFFDSRLQTFVYNHDGWHMYDPYLIEFFIRNKVLNYGDKFVFVSHAAEVGKTFGMDYNKTFFRCLEQPSKFNVECSTTATAALITDINSLFVTKMTEYYQVRYNDSTPFMTRFITIPMEVLEQIESGEYFAKGHRYESYNLWIAYFKHDISYITEDILDAIKSADALDNKDCFYSLAINIFILEKYIENMMA